MSNILKTFCIAAMLFAAGVSDHCNAQEKYAKAYEKKGDKAFERGDYAEALEYYMMGKKFILKPLSLIFKCGEACRMLNDYDKAEYWYQKVLIENDTLNINKEFPLLYLHLAEVAKCNGNTIQAQHFLNTCLMDCPDITIRKKAKDELKNLRWIFDNNKEKKDITVTNLGTNVNNEFSQSSTFIFKDSIMFFDSPTFKQETEDGQTLYSDVYNNVFYCFIDEDFYTPAKPLDFGEINRKRKNTSNFFFDTLTQTAYFTRCSMRKGKDNCQIYYSMLSEGKWSKAKRVESVYDKESSSSCPVVARDENGKSIMYFSSNRPGGYGGYDLWYVDLSNDEAKPVNLGPTINTSGNEVTPHYCHDEQSLYFSSDHHPGYGGFDIFRSEGWLCRWTTPENLMQPINSPANDLYPFISISAEQGYFTSNRKTEYAKDNKTCCNDIYRWDRQMPEVPTEKVIKAKESFNPAFDLPITLYFHNDEPDPGSNSNTTETSYRECYKQYSSLINQYKAVCSHGLNDSLEAIEVEKMERFFTDKIDKGMTKLDLMAQYILKQVENGRKVRLQIRGYASALYNEGYNYILSERRIVSVENYLREWNDSILNQYFDKKDEKGEGQISIVQMAMGKLESTSDNPENVEEKRRSVFTPQAMQERRIEIKVVEVK